MPAATKAAPPPVRVHGASVEMVPLAKLKAYEKNARLHPEDQLKALEAIIRDSGFTAPLVIDPQNSIIAGHGRALVAKRLGMVEVPCVRVTGLTEPQITALRLSDNQAALRGGWDKDLLLAELSGLQGLGFDLSLTAFAPLELGSLGVKGFSTEERLAAAEATPTLPAKPVVAMGEIWLLGGHRLIIGDSTDPKVVDRLLKGAKPPTLLLTDPPYGIGYEYRTHDDKDAKANSALVEKAFALAPKGKVWTPGPMNLRRDLDRFGEAKILFWHKGFAAAGNGLGGASTVEPVLVISPPAKKLPDDYLHFGTDREKLNGIDLRKLHSCPKPVALFAHLARCFSPENGGIYDPFCGSGTTLISCEMEGRRCYAVELDPAYAEVIITRWQKFTGKIATREDSRTLASLKRKKAA